MKTLSRMAIGLAAVVILGGLLGPARPIRPQHDAANYSSVSAATSLHGIENGAGTNATVDALRASEQLLGIPAGATYVYVSDTNMGWYPEGFGVSDTSGTANEPMDNLQTIASYLGGSAGVGGPIVFVLDPEEVFELSASFLSGGIADNCGGTGEPCFIFMGGDLSGQTKPTIKCVTGETSNTNGWIEIAADDDMVVFSNIRFQCLYEPDDTRLPLFYNAGDLLLHNVFFDGIVGKNVAAIRTVAGSNTLGINASGYVRSTSDYDGDIDGVEALHCLGYLDPYYCCQSATACLDWNEGNGFIFDIDAGNSVWIGGEWYEYQEATGNATPIVRFAKIAGGDTTFLATTFRHWGKGENPTTLKSSFELSGTDTEVTFLYTTVVADQGASGITGGNAASALNFEAAEAAQDVDVRLFQSQFIGLERTFNFTNLLADTSDSIYARCINNDEPDGNKDGKSYDIWAVGAFAATDLSLDIQNSLFDDDEGTESYHWKGTAYDQIDEFRAVASDAFVSATSFFGIADDTTAGGEGSADVGGAADTRSRGNSFNAVGGCATADCAKACVTGWTETLSIEIPELVFGPELSIQSLKFNASGDENIGGKY